MDKLEFIPAQGDAPEDFYIITQTVVGGKSYLLVSDEDPEADGEGTAYILRDDSASEDADALYTMLLEGKEYEDISRIFRELLLGEDIDLSEEEIT